jgi:hypothetical protein
VPEAQVLVRILASTPPADGKEIPFLVTVGVVQAPEVDAENAGKWFVVVRAENPDGSEERQNRFGPSETEELALTRAESLISTMRKEGIPLSSDGKDDCPCPLCTHRKWRRNAHSIAKLTSYVGAALFVVSWTFPIASWMAFIPRELGSILIYFSVGISWSSFSLSRRLLHARRQG